MNNKYEDFNIDYGTKGKPGEIKTVEFLNYHYKNQGKRCARVSEIPGLKKKAYDAVMYKDDKCCNVEIKTQRNFGFGIICVEWYIFRPEQGCWVDGWFMKDAETDIYVFNSLDTKDYLLISRDALHKYIEANRIGYKEHTVRNETSKLSFIDTDIIFKWCQTNNLLCKMLVDPR